MLSSDAEEKEQIGWDGLRKMLVAHLDQMIDVRETSMRTNVVVRRAIGNADDLDIPPLGDAVVASCRVVVVARRHRVPGAADCA